MVAASVIIPLYRKPDTIVRAVQSVLDQSFQDFEIIVVDDGSPDDSVARLESLSDPRIRLVRQANAGPGVARNRGAALANGAYLAFLDADDCWRPGFLAEAMRILAADPGLAAFVAAYDTGDHATLQRNLLLELVSRSGEITVPLDMPAAAVKDHVDAAQASCVVLRRAVFGEYGGFYDRPHCTYGEDTYLWLRVILFRRVWFCREQLVEFHVEDSELGVGRKGERPTNPALIDPEPLRSAAGARMVLLDRLLGVYRLRETQKLARAGEWRAIRKWRRRFPWPEFPGWSLFLQDRRLEARCLYAMLSGRR